MFVRPVVTSRTIAAICVSLIMILPGCIEKIQADVKAPDWDLDYYLIDPPGSYDDSRNFTVTHPWENVTWGNSSWTVYGNEHGGNCCEHYLAATKEGWILNFGGEYPTLSLIHI